MGDLSREPSMEEILSSIRRVIAREEPAGQDVVQDISGTADDTADDDVLELTEASQEDVMATSARDEVPPAPELVSAGSAAASLHSLEALAALVAGENEASVAAIPAGGDLSVNALVQATIRPMLKEWLDANLPSVVERLVAKEIKRITSGRI